MSDELCPAPPRAAGADLWEAIDALCGWLDAHRPADGPDAVLLRILKLSEEVGEVAQAVVGATGQNPRKGTTHTCYLGLYSNTCWSERSMHVSYVRHISSGCRRSSSRAPT
ncbi:MazG-like family protein [Streptomyces griseoflavus]|uniref:MazG-like family protein n=1 Tax=Streptomyces griseoflavus TaxID=35619 RepID=UPI003D733BAF